MSNACGGIVHPKKTRESPHRVALEYEAPNGAWRSGRMKSREISPKSAPRQRTSLVALVRTKCFGDEEDVNLLEGRIYPTRRRALYK